MRSSLIGLDKIYHLHAIMPGAVRSSPAFDNASRALQRLTLDNEAAAAVATARGSLRRSNAPSPRRSSAANRRCCSSIGAAMRHSRCAAAVATADLPAMEQVLETARKQNNPVIANRMEASFALPSNCCAS